MAGIHVVVHHMPTFVSIEPANFCQLACPECPVGIHRASTTHLPANYQPILDNTRDNYGTIPRPLYKQIIAQIAPYAHTLQLFWQGEPLLCDQLPEMIRLARQAGLYTIVSTNAQRLDLPLARALAEAGLNRIIVSMDGWTQATYEQYRRGGSVEKVKQAVHYLRQAKTETRARMLIELQCLYLSTNEAEWGIFRREYKALGADRLTMKTAQLYDYKQGSPLMPADQRFSRYRYEAKLGEYIPKRPLHNHCYRLWSGCVIDVNGNVLPCCYDKSEQYVLGNIREQSLRQIWHGQKAQDFRGALLTRRAQITICTNCDE